MSSDLFIIALLLSYVNRYKLVGKSTRLGQCAAQIDNSVHFTKPWQHVTNWNAKRHLHLECAPARH